MRTGTFSFLLALAPLMLAARPAHPQSSGTPQTPPPAPPAPSVKVGDAAPDFTLPYLAAGRDPSRPERKQIALSSFKGKQPVVLAFFPAAFSPG
jgi:hypothetical protein